MASYGIEPGRGAWVQVVDGEIELDGHPMRAGDGASVEGEHALTIKCLGDRAEILLFDLP